MHAIAKTSLYIAFAFLCMSNSCTKDTCNTGVTFEEIDAQTGPVDGDLMPLHMSLKADTTLPLAYFQNAILMRGDRGYSFDNLEWQNDHALVDTFQINEIEAWTLFLKANQLESRPLELHFQLPDRRDFINCVHPGSSDAYYLDLSLTLDLSADSTWQVSLFDWKETLAKGGF